MSLSRELVYNPEVSPVQTLANQKVARVAAALAGVPVEVLAVILVVFVAILVAVSATLVLVVVADAAAVDSVVVVAVAVVAPWALDSICSIYWMVENPKLL